MACTRTANPGKGSLKVGEGTEVRAKLANSNTRCEGDVACSPPIASTSHQPLLARARPCQWTVLPVYGHRLTSGTTWLFRRQCQ